MLKSIKVYIGLTLLLCVLCFIGIGGKSFLSSASSTSTSELMRLYNLATDGNAEALTSLHEFAEQDNGTAQELQGNIYAYGQGVEQNRQKGNQWWLKAVDTYHKLAQQGDAEAQYHLGNMYFNNKGVRQNRHEAIRWYLKSAEQGNFFAQNFLGYLYSDRSSNFGIVPNKEESLKWYNRASERLHKLAEEGDIDAAYSLGEAYAKGSVVKSDSIEADKWHKIAADGDRKNAENGDTNAQFRLGVMYESGKGVKRNIEKAIEWYSMSAEQGNNHAQIALGNIYKNGHNYEKAIYWYRLAAEQGSATAKVLLGEMYETGKGVVKSQEETIKWYRKAAEQGSGQAQFRLGIEYGNGSSKNQHYNLPEAIKWYKKAAEQGMYDAFYSISSFIHRSNDALIALTELAEQGYIEAQCRLGNMYHAGNGVKKDIAEAVKWYKMAAEQEDIGAMLVLGNLSDGTEAIKWYRLAAELGSTNAMSSIGGMYEYGNRVKKDMWEAIKWYRLAAEQGDSYAQIHLGELYYDGKGVKKDITEAIKWYRMAAEGGNGLHSRTARLFLDKLNKTALSSRNNTSFNSNGSINGDKVNVRTSPNTSAKVITQLNTGHPIKIGQKNGDWYFIQTASGTKGWVFGKYVKFK